MPILAYDALSDHLHRTPAAEWPAVTLICGEEMLCKQSLDRVLAHLMPEAEQTLGIERFDGSVDALADVLTCMNTYALLAPVKVVVLDEARLFYSPKAQQGLREKMTQAARSGDLKKAERPFLNLMALCGLDFTDLSTAAARKKIADDEDGEPAAWLLQLVDHCREKGMRVPDRKDDGDLLKQAMDRGFPDGHRLLVTTDFVDRRKVLFKAIGDAGLIVDCTVPKGASRAERTAQESVMQAVVEEVLGRTGKQMTAEARRRLLEWTGFDMRTLAGNLEKLISYVGDRQRIVDTDVTALLQRTRKDPIFAFTNAVADRDLPACLFHLHNLLAEGMHPLQLMSAAANQIRRLLLARDFIDRDGGRTWSAGISFAQFKGTVLKALQAADSDHAERVNGWASALTPPAAEKGRAKKAAAASDLMLVKNPRSPFPVFQTLKKADAFTRADLILATQALSDADWQMKSSGRDPRLLLEAFLIRFCGAERR